MAIDKDNIVVWMGMGGNRYHAERLFPIIQKLGVKLRIISEWEPNPEFPLIEYIKWDIKTCLKYVSESKVGIAPQDVKLQPCKSAVKVVTYLNEGIPVVASPLDAYKEIIKNGVNGFIANNDSEWEIYLAEILFAPDAIYGGMQFCAANSVSMFEPKQIIKMWESVIHRCGTNLPKG